MTLPDAFFAQAFYWTLVLMLAALAARFGLALRGVRRDLESVAEPKRKSPSPTLNATQLQALVELSADFFWQSDAEHHFTLFSEGARARSLTLPPSLPELASAGGQWALFPDADPPAVAQLVQRHVPLRVTLRCRNTSDGVRFLELNGLPVFERGAFKGYQGVGRNITDRIEAQLQLQESRARYQEVIDSVREVVFSSDAAKRFTFLNQAWEKITGNPENESLGRPLLDFIHPDDRRVAEQELDRLLAGKLDAYHGQVRIPTRDGEIRWVEITAHQVGKPYDGDVALAGTLEDISSRKIAEMTLRNINYELEARVRMRTAELEASNRELEAFSYSVSHDLRAPLRSIDGFARILEEDLGERLDSEGADHLERIRKAAGRMAQLIDNLIELARLTRHAVKKENVNLSELAVQIIDELKDEEPDRVVEVSVTSDLMVTADRTLMHVVLDNLLRNAWKFSSREEVTRVSFHANRSGERRVFCVSDNGVGFDMAFATHLFRAFHRLHDTTDFPGTGIGLANVQRIIQRHGGKIWAESAPGRGARFYFTLDP